MKEDNSPTPDELHEFEVSGNSSLLEHVRTRQYHGSCDDHGRLVGGTLSTCESYTYSNETDKMYRTGHRPEGGWTYHLCATRNGDVFGAGRSSRRYDSKEEAIAAGLKSMERQEKRYRKLYPPRAFRA